MPSQHTAVLTNSSDQRSADPRSDPSSPCSTCNTCPRRPRSGPQYTTSRPPAHLCTRTRPRRRNCCPNPVSLYCGSVAPPAASGSWARACSAGHRLGSLVMGEIAGRGLAARRCVGGARGRSGEERLLRRRRKMWLGVLVLRAWSEVPRPRLERFVVVAAAAVV